MKRTRVSDIYADSAALVGKEVCVKGWVRTRRGNKHVQFVALNDGSTIRNLQIVLDMQAFTDEQLKPVTTGSAICVTGLLVESMGKGQSVEVQAKTLEVYGTADPEAYPLQKKGHTLEFLREIAHLRPRTNTFYAVFRIRSLAAQLLHAFFAERGFVYVHTPIITTSDCEGAGEMFQTTTLPLENVPKLADGTVDYSQDFFGKQANLTVSGQLNVETFCMAFRNVYTFGPTFRAEKSYTPRHAAEFWMVEPEIAFADLFDDMELAEDMLKYVISHILAEAPEEMTFLDSFVEKGLIDRLTKLVNSDFARCSYTDAVDILQKSGQKFDYPVAWGIDLQTEHERYLSEKHFGKPVFVYDYPKEIKAFYMRLNDDGKTVAAADLLVPGVGELIGGSQREERLDVLKNRIEELGMREEDYDFYLDTRRYGTNPHAGFGLGFERLIMYVTGMQNIRDVLPFPRTTGSAEY